MILLTILSFIVSDSLWNGVLNKCSIASFGANFKFWLDIFFVFFCLGQMQDVNFRDLISVSYYKINAISVIACMAHIVSISVIIISGLESELSGSCASKPSLNDPLIIMSIISALFCLADIAMVISTYYHKSRNIHQYNLLDQDNQDNQDV